MKYRRRSISHVLAVAIALVTFPSSGQEQTPLADLGAGTDELITPAIPEGVNVKIRTSITDDGRRGDELLPADQLMIAFNDAVAYQLSVDILDEQGRCVQQHTFMSHPGKNALPIDVTGLVHGRYAVRVQRAGSAHISRFQRN